MAENYLSRHEYDRLSIASKDLVRMVGGEERALEITGYYQRPQISRCTTINAQDRRFFSIRAVAELEADAVESGCLPPVTRVLADMAGFDLVRRRAAASDVSALASLSDLVSAFADASGSITDAYADGILTASERETCVERLQRLIDQSARTISILRGERVLEDGK